MTTIQKFNELQSSKEILLVGNAWDLLSALTLEKAGFKAIGTTSWGIANSLGYADGELIDFEKHLGIIKTITKNVKIPVSADIEAGYSEDTETIVENTLRTADIGVAGINIEDSPKKQVGLRKMHEHCNLLSKIRTALNNHGYKDFYINARTDTYFQTEDPFLETVNRAKAYVESGASGVFIPGITDFGEIEQLTMSVNAPINVLSLPGLTNCNVLNDLGVKRFSFGNALADKIIAFLAMNATQLLETKDTSFLYEDLLRKDWHSMEDKINLSFDEMWDKIIACDQKYDGLFYTAVKTTGIYCRPSCRSRKPKKKNVDFYHDIHRVENAGYRACKRCQPEVEHSPHVELVRNVIAFLINHYKSKLVLQDIANYVGVSPFYLERLFKQETSETPRTYLEKIRIDKAAYLLTSTNQSNLEICYEVGFQSPSNFYKVFRRFKNCSPSEYRNLVGEELQQ